jgi:Phospholipase_D-nuclease N-terminal
VSRAPRVQRLAEWLIRAVCRRLPADERAERCREWTAELPAILDDQSIRPAFRRALRALSFCAGISRTASQLRRSARAGARTAPAAGPFGTEPARHREFLLRRAVLGVLIWLVVAVGAVALLRVLLGPPGWTLGVVLALAIGFDAFCLVDIARAEQVRYLPKWAWVLICLIQTPSGGIIYLCFGHMARPRPVPPGDATP